MPEISRFFGIIIAMYYNDHSPPHFHAKYGGHQVLINIETMSIIDGILPPRALGLVMEWAALHQDELRIVWQQAREWQPLSNIAPLE